MRGSPIASSPCSPPTRTCRARSTPALPPACSRPPMPGRPGRRRSPSSLLPYPHPLPGDRPASARHDLRWHHRGRVQEHGRRCRLGHRERQPSAAADPGARDRPAGARHALCGHARWRRFQERQRRRELVPNEHRPHPGGDVGVRSRRTPPVFDDHLCGDLRGRLQHGRLHWRWNATDLTGITVNDARHRSHRAGHALCGHGRRRGLQERQWRRLRGRRRTAASPIWSSPPSRSTRAPPPPCTGGRRPAWSRRRRPPRAGHPPSSGSCSPRSLPWRSTRRRLPRSTRGPRAPVSSRASTAAEAGRPAVPGSRTSLVNALAIGAAAPATIYAGTAGGGVFKSVDAGASWAPANARIDQPERRRAGRRTRRPPCSMRARRAASSRASTRAYPGHP